MLHAVHTFHDEAWDLFTILGGDLDRYGDLQQLSSSRKKRLCDCTVIHCSGTWVPQICVEMAQFQLALVGKNGNRLKIVQPFNQDQFFVAPHAEVAFVFTVEKKQLFILTTIIGCSNLKSGSTRYWPFIDASGY